MYYPKIHAQSWRDYQKPKRGSIILSIVLAVIMGGLFFWALAVGIDRTEQAECIKWQEYAKDYPLYQSAGWQLEQCEHYGLPLPK